MSFVLDNSAAMCWLLNDGRPADVTYALNLQKAFGPQISPIYADGSEACLTTLDHLPGQPWALAAPLLSLRNLCHLRIELGF